MAGLGGASRARRIRGRRSRARGFTDRGRAVAAAGGLLNAAGLLLGFPDLSRVGMFALALAVLARVMTWRRRPRLHIHRSLHPAPLVAGRPGRISVQLRNTGPHGTDPLAAAERVSPWLGSTARLVIPPLRPGEETSGSYDVRPTRRGRHLAGPLRVVSRDPLGLTHLSTDVGSGLEVLVLPPVHDLSGSDPTGLGMGHEGDAPASVLAGTEHDASVRDYRYGDDLRRVHWGVTAHRGRLMVRHEALPRLRRAVLLLDAAAATWGLDAPDAPADRDPRPFDAEAGFEWAVEALASIGAHLSGLGFTLHLLVAGAAPGPDRGDDPARPLLLDDLLTRLALVTPGRAAGDAAPTRGQAATLAVAGSLSAAAREVAGAGGLVVLATGDRSVGAAHETFGVLRTGLTGLAMVVDTRAFAHGGNRDWWIPGPRPAAPAAGSASPGATTALAAGAAAVPDGGLRPQAWTEDSGGADARRLCGYARSGGWRAVSVVPSMTPALVWSQLLGTPRVWGGALTEAAP